MNGICNFISGQSRSSDILFYHFVLEANLQNLTQPLCKPGCIAYLAFRGEAVFRADGVEYALMPGTLFFTLPDQPHEILARDRDFAYLYISFGGRDAVPLLKRFGVCRENAVFGGFAHLIDFWFSAIRRIGTENAGVLTESVLLYTLSFLSDSGLGKDRTNVPRFESILDYVNRNFADPQLSVRRVADIFFYNEKYLSSLFLRNTGVRFTEYLTKLRMEHGVKLLKAGRMPVAQLAAECGFSDPLYFSKVFKKHTGYTPSEFPEASRQS